MVRSSENIKGADSEPDSTSDNSNLDRRSMLKSVGMIGSGIVFTTGTAAARKGGRGATKGAEHSGRGNPQEDCGCYSRAPSGKYDFEDCEFVLSEGDDVVEITGYENKDGETCEPISVTYETKDDIGNFDVSKVCAFGGRDNVTDEDPDGTFDEVLTNPGGQRAAISNITFCTGVIAFQVDLVYGEPIEQFDPSAGRTYAAEDRILQARWSDPDFGEGRLEERLNVLNAAYQQCLNNGLEIEQEITFRSDGTAYAEIDPGTECEVSDFALVAYTAPLADEPLWYPEYEGHEYDPTKADQQVLWDADESGDANGVFEVDLPVPELNIA